MTKTISKTNECSSKVSKLCLKTVTVSKNWSVRRNLRKNDGKFICSKCCLFLKKKFGKDTSSYKYNKDTTLFKNIDSLEKAYLLGFIASDGTIGRYGGIEIYQHRDDIEIIQKIKDCFKFESPITITKRNIARLCISSVEMARDISQLLGLDYDAKSHKKDFIVRFPDLRSDDLKWAFLRGYFDGDGHLVTERDRNKSLICSVGSTSNKMLDDINEFVKLPCRIDYGKAIYWNGENALKFLNNIYSELNFPLFLKRKMSLYQKWKTWKPILKGRGRGNQGRNEYFSWGKISESAELTTIEDSAFRIKLIDMHEECLDKVSYHTGLRINVQNDFVLNIKESEELSQLGFSILEPLIIDRYSIGEVIIVLTKRVENTRILNDLESYVEITIENYGKDTN